MTDEERKARQREASRKWRQNHPLTEEEREKRNARRRAKRKGVDKINGNARHLGIEKRSTSKDERKRRQEKHERELRENEEAKALGLTYGKYQMLKQAGKLPNHIPLPEKPKSQKLGVYMPPGRGLDEFNAFRERMFSVAAARILEERREKRKRIKEGDKTVSSYMERMKKQKEAVERARTLGKD